MKLNAKKWVSALSIGVTAIGFTTPAFAATYQVQPNDTLWTIAQHQQVSLASLQAANPNVDPMNLQSGQTIQLSDSTSNTGSKYSVTAGDTFWKIAQKIHVPVADLENTNPSVNPLNIYPGIVLNVPHSKASISSVGSVESVGSVNSVGTSSSTVSTASGKSYSYSREISGVATAYTASNSSNGGWGAVDYFGNPLKLGTIAVDPSVIPLGSTVYITGYSFAGLPVGGMIAHAVDEGGAIKGSHIDIFIPTSDTAASDFGMQNVKIYILK